MDLATVDLKPVASVLRAAIADRAFPGCTAAIGSHSGAPRRLDPGTLGWELETPVRADSIYDLASLTKVVATTATSMVLHREGSLDPRTPVQKIVPEFRGDGKDSVRLEHLMTHTSGLPAWKPLYKQHRGYRAVLDAILETPLEAPPGTRAVYSDLGAILWGDCLARLGSLPLATLAWSKVFEPLAMRETFYRPPSSELWRIAPTELDESFRKRLLRGEVHDENAFAMGGVSAHAGLFSTASDVARLAREVLRGLRGDSQVFSQETVQLFTTRRNLVRASSRALGWDTRSDKYSSSGNLFSAGSFGHTGFTGTSIWIDPKREIYAVLLTNRVHPTRANRKISRVRVQFHDAVVRAIFGV